MRCVYLLFCFSGIERITGIPDRQVWGSSDCLSAKVSWIDERSMFVGLSVSEWMICAAVFLRS